MRSSPRTHALLLILAVTVVSAAGIAALVLAQPRVGIISGIVSSDLAGFAPQKLALQAEHTRTGDVRSIRCDRSGRFRQSLPIGNYRLSLETATLELPAQKIAVVEGLNTPLNLKLRQRPTEFEVIVHQHVYPLGKPAEIAVKGHALGDRLRVALYQADLQRLSVQEQGNLAHLADPQHVYDKPINTRNNPNLRPAGERSELITTRDADGVFYQRVPVTLPKPGVYLVTVEADGKQELGWLMQSDIALLTKTDSQRLLAQVCSLTSGAPVPRTQIEAFRGGQSVLKSQTDSQGLLMAEVPAGDGQSPLVVIATSGASQAFVTPWVSSTEQTPYRVHFQTDRPIYRPGHLVRFRLLARSVNGARYEVPRNQTFTVRITDSNGTLIYQQPLRLNEWGSCSGEVTLSDEAPTGEYRVEWSAEPFSDSAYFTVAAYRKPEFALKITPARERYTRGETVQAAVQADYFFGSPLPNAAVEYSVYRNPYWMWLGEDADEEMLDEEYEDYGWDGGGLVAEGTTRTDAFGRATITFPTDDRGDAEMDARYLVDVTISDDSGRSANESADIIVTRGDFAVLVEPDSWIVEPHRPTTVQVRTVTYDRKPLANVPLQVGLQRQDFDRRRRAQPDQQMQSLVTDAAGRGQFTLTPGAPGDYRVLARAQDTRGNFIVESANIWCSSDYEPVETGLRRGLKVILDRRQYQPGERARVLVQSAEPIQTALLTVEGDRLYDWQLITLQRGSTLVELPVLEEYLPNVYVCASAIHKQDLHQAQRRLNVSPQERGLQVEVKPAQPQVLPRAQETCTITTRDADGQPVSAEVCLAAVDESIFALAPDETPKLLGFFYNRRENLVNTDYSFPSVYLSADKAALNQEMRRNFPDTAYWNPSVITNDQGVAQVSFPVPDTLTRWRLTARAATLETTVGETTASFLCRKPLFVRLEAPRFVTQGDEVEIVGLIHNESGVPQQTQVTLQAEGLTLQQPATRTVQVGADPVRVSFHGTARNLQPVKLSLSAQAASLADGMEQTIPCRPAGVPVTTQAAGVLEGAAAQDQTLALDPTALPGATRLRVRLTPSLVGVTYGGLEYLATYPYGCVEQTMSAFLPDLALLQVLKQSNRSDPKLATRLPKMVQDGLSRLYSLYNGSGWGWWRYGNMDPWMTAYVLHGLAQAKRAGFPINEGLYESGLQSLEDALGVKLPERDRALAALTFAEAGKQQQAQVALAPLLRSRLRPEALAVAICALQALGQPVERERAGYYLTQLLSQAQEGPQVLYWPAQDPLAGFADTETAAWALQALLQEDPQDPRAQKIIRWLLSNRRGAGWFSTRDTAAATIALCEYLRQHPPLAGAGSLDLMVNGASPRTVSLSTAGAWQPEQVLSLSPADLRTGDNHLILRKTGTGQVWYVAELKQFLPEPKPTAAGAGMTITRSFHRLRHHRDWERGAYSSGAETFPRRSFRVGDIIEVQTRVKLDRDLDHAMIEVPLPAGCEATSRGEVEAGDWDLNYDDVDLRDDRVCFFVRHLPAGETVFTQTVRATTAGQFRVCPASVSSMYFPDRVSYSRSLVVKLGR